MCVLAYSYNHFRLPILELFQEKINKSELSITIEIVIYRNFVIDI